MAAVFTFFHENLDCLLFRSLLRFCFFTVKLRVSIFFTKDLINCFYQYIPNTFSNLQYESSVTIILLVFSQPQSILISSFEQFSVVSINVCWFFSLFFSFGAAGETTLSWILELLFHSLNVGLVSYWTSCSRDTINEMD